MSGIGDPDEFAVRDVFVNILHGTGRYNDIQIRTDEKRGDLNGLQFFPGYGIASDTSGEADESLKPLAGCLDRTLPSSWKIGPDP